MGAFEQVKSVMFDLDNTLIVRRLSLEKLSYYVTRFFFPTQEEKHEQIRKQFCACFISGYDRRAECFEQFKRMSGMDPAIDYKRFVEMWTFYYPFCTVRDPGAEVALQLRQRGYAVSILTNGQSVFQNAKIDVAGFREWFSPIVISEEIGFEKPDVRAFQIACGMTGFRPEQTAYIGDYGANDIVGARNAGMLPIWYSAYMTWDEAIPRAAVEIDSLWKLLDLFPVIEAGQ